MGGPLIENSAIASARDSDQRTALIIASRNGNTQVDQMLIENSASADATDNDQRAVLMIASSKGHTHVAQMLIENGAIEEP